MRMMFWSVWLPEGDPHEWFCTVAFIWIAYAMPRMAALWKPAPVSSMNLRHMIFTEGDSPAMPMPLLATAPMVPEAAPTAAAMPGDTPDARGQLPPLIHVCTVKTCLQ